jgi:hypothetical protein
MKTKEQVMTELQSSQRRSFTAKTIFGLLLAVVMVGAFATAGSAENTGTPRSGVLHVEKECSHISDNYCTITASDLNAIDVGMNVVYTDLHVEGTELISHLYVDGPGNNDADGYVELDLTPGPNQFSGPIVFSGGTGRFSGFHANLWVTCEPGGSPCAWDGTYKFTPPGHDQ